jgi:hypothetical protein
VRSTLDTKKKYLAVGRIATPNTVAEYLKKCELHERNTVPNGKFAVAAMFDMLPPGHPLYDNPENFYPWVGLYDEKHEGTKIIMPWEVMSEARKQIARGEKPFIPIYEESCTPAPGKKLSPYQDLYTLANRVRTHMEQKGKTAKCAYFGKSRGGEIPAYHLADQNGGLVIPDFRDNMIAVDDIAETGKGMMGIREYNNVTFAAIDVREGTALPPDVCVHDAAQTGKDWMVYMNDRNHPDWGTTHDRVKCTTTISRDIRDIEML